MPCTGKQILRQFFGIFFGIPKNYLKFSDLKPPLRLDEVENTIRDLNAFKNYIQQSHCCNIGNSIHFMVCIGE